MELPKIKKISDDISKLTKAQMWGKFFLYGSKIEKKEYISQLAQQNRGIQMAVTILKNISQDELNWYHESRYWIHVSDELSAHNAAVRQGLEEGRTKGLEEGRAEGRLEGKLEGRLEGKLESQQQIAKNLLNACIDINIISKATDLSVEEIEKLRD